MTAMRTTFAAFMSLGTVLGMAVGGCGGKTSGAGSGGTTMPGTGGVTASGGTTAAGGTTSGGGAGGATAGGGGAPASDGSFEPCVAGATWSYSTDDIDSDGGVFSGTKTVTCERTEPVPGRAAITAWRIHTVVPGIDAQEQLTWQFENAAAIVRYRDEIYAAGGTTTLLSSSIYAPAKGRVDLATGHLATGAIYSETFTETVTDVGASGNSTSSSSKSYEWKVVDANESITVPAGSFKALHLQKFNGNSKALDKDYWFVRGVGKVKETSEAGRTELLTTFHIP